VTSAAFRPRASTAAATTRWACATSSSLAEIDYAKVDKMKGMNVTIVTTAADDNGARALLKSFGMPFRVGA